MRANWKYLVAVALLAVLAVVFGFAGTVMPVSELASPQQSSSDSVTHFMNPPTYDSGWVNISTKAGQYFTLTHGLNTTEVVVDITGKQSLDAADGALAWNRTYGGAEWEVAKSVVQTSDRGYAIAGYTDSFGAGSWDMWLIKTDAAGNVQWNKTYGGTGYEEAYSVVQTFDGGYALAGETWSFETVNPDFWLVKTDSTGNMQWNKTYGGTQGETAYSVIQTFDGGYALAGMATISIDDKDFWLVKTDSAGNMQWNKTYGGAGYEEAYSVVQTFDGGYALAGYNSTGFGLPPDLQWVKTDSAGNMQWIRTYGGAEWDFAYSVVQTFDGGYALAGGTRSYGAGSWDMWLIKTDAAGNVQLNKTYGGAPDDCAYSVAQTFDGGYAIAGYTVSYSVGMDDFWLVKTDSTGNMQWNQTYGGTPGETAYSVIQTFDGGYALAGTAAISIDDEDFWLVKVSAQTNLEHQRNLGSETGLTWIGLTNSTITLYRGPTDPYWNYVRVRIWVIKEPTWQFGDINQDGVVDVQDLYILSQNYGKTFSLLSLGGIVAVAGVHTYKKRKQPK